MALGRFAVIKREAIVRKKIHFPKERELAVEEHPLKNFNFMKQTQSLD